jgi:general stress protein 26
MPSRRDQITMTPAEVDAFLREEKTVVCATNGVGGWPHLMPLWYVLRPTGPNEALELWAWTFAKSQKAKNLERDPKTTLQVEAGTEYHLLRGVMIEAETELVRETAEIEALGLEIFGRYTPSDTEGNVADEVRAMVAQQATKRVAMRFVERRRVTWDHRKLGGVY